MNVEEYFRSVTTELNVLRDRVRNYIRHWPTDGAWKESILRTVLRRHLPQNIGIGTGFVVATEKVSSQIDILLYDTARPVLFRDGDLVIITPDAVLGIIEVKTQFVASEFAEVCEKLANNIESASGRESMQTNHRDKRFFGIFYYESDLGNTPQEAKRILASVVGAVRGSQYRTINGVSIGVSLFARYWYFSPVHPRNTAIDRYHAYRLDRNAPAYFVHNVIEHLCRDSVYANNSAWYPEKSKEVSKIAEMPRRPNPPETSGN